MDKTILLSDQKPAKVRVLGLFELDRIEPPLGPYSYSVLLATGDVIEDEYIFPDQPPDQPKKPIEECQEGDWEYYQWQEFNTYQTAIKHEKKRTVDHERYLRDVAGYILDNCINDEDKSRLVVETDWQRVQQAVIVPQLTEETIAQCLRDTFQGFIW